MSKDKVVVFGGAGFLGSHLADSLQDAGYQVLIFDAAPSRWARPGQQTMGGDVLDRAAVERAVEGARYVYHLAGIADIGEACEHPRRTIEYNVMGSTNIFEACLRHEVQRVLFASTVYVYSDKGSFYRVSKQATELVVEAYAERFGLEYTILRYGSLYGPRAQAWNGLKRFISQAVTEGRIVYPGTGAERREYIHVQDAARLSVQALDAQFADQCLILTGTQTMTSREMLAIIKEVLGRPVELEFSESAEDYSITHYGLTPYRYTPKQGRKLVPAVFIDLGQGILDIIEEISQQA